MRYNQQPQGYTHSEIAHTVPISSIRDLEELHPKQQSLIDKCFKAINKERMAGCLINVQRKSRETQQIRAKYDGDRDINDLYGYLNSSIKKRYMLPNPQIKRPPLSYLNSLKVSRNTHNKSTVISSAHKSSNHDQQYLLNSASNSNISHINSKNDKELKKQRYRLQNLTQPLISDPDQLIYNRDAIKLAGEGSFISAIQNNYNQEQKPTYQSIKDIIYNRKSLSINRNVHINSIPKGIAPSVNNSQDFQQIKLPLLKNRNRVQSIGLINSRESEGILNSSNNINLSSATSIVKPIKKSPDYNINTQFWRYLTAAQLMLSTSLRRRKTSINVADLSTTQGLPLPKQIKSSLFKPTIPSSSRQSFYQYLYSLPHSFTRLIQFVFMFFNVKIPAELSALHYSGMLEQLKAVSNRAWCVVAFVFWDRNRDGVINSADVFNIFREFNQFQEQIQGLVKIKRIPKQVNKIIKRNITEKIPKSTKQQENIDQRHKKTQKIVNPPIKTKQSTKKKKKKENTLNLQITQSINKMQNVLKKYKPQSQQENQKEKQKQQEKMEKNLEGISGSIDQGNNSTVFCKTDQEIPPKVLVLRLQKIQEAIKKFKEELNRINNKLTGQDKQSISYQQLKQSDSTTVSYLQQVILTNPVIKYEQILPLFSAGDQKKLVNPSQDSKPSYENNLELFPRSLTIKCSSSYKQCFISTEHNEQTRLLRESIENYKLELRKKRQKRNEQLMKKVKGNLLLGNQINYTRVVESNMGGIIKDIIFLILGLEQT